MSMILPRESVCDRPESPTRLLRLCWATLTAMLRSLRNRREALMLSDLPDNLLHDVGLKRDDVHAALKTSWREDPTYILALRAQERRCRD